MIKLKAHHVRYLLHYLKNELGTYTEWNPKDNKDWVKRKGELAKFNPLVTVPYLRTGDTVISRPGAMLMAICMKANRNDLLGRTVDEAVQVRAIQSASDDIRNFVSAGVHMDKKSLTEKYKTWETRLSSIVTNLTSTIANKEFLTGQLTVADFDVCQVMELYDWFSNIVGFENPFIKSPQLTRLVKTVKTLPGVSEFVTSPQARSMPWMRNGSAQFLND